MESVLFLLVDVCFNKPFKIPSTIKMTFHMPMTLPGRIQLREHEALIFYDSRIQKQFVS